jgi:hypothetical protein
VAESSYRAVADDLDVGKSSLEKFVNRKAHPLKNWYKLRQGYLQYQMEEKGSLQDPKDMAMLVLETVANVPAEERSKAITALARAIEEIHRTARAPRPEWLDHLFRMGEDESPAKPPAPHQPGPACPEPPEPTGT